ncbi:hypothetical protein NQ317_009335 [Molorchus minor]|uniref:Uncharacterized protein n=1 Tax=Molorchus minor TaxID=1323400 RepID=A0ABQ9JIS3_9CUCU|nr:hypothetical protein NQ317_009335 [Molorchus minor]
MHLQRYQIAHLRTLGPHNSKTRVADNFNLQIRVQRPKYKILKRNIKRVKKECPELKFLREKCISPDSLINEVAASALINLVKDEVLQIETTMAECITMIPLTRYHLSLARILVNLLNIEIKRKLAINKECKNLIICSYPHPL